MDISKDKSDVTIASQREKKPHDLSFTSTKILTTLIPIVWVQQIFVLLRDLSKLNLFHINTVNDANLI